jgi:DNA helicase-2/ATP-dependent DNA helicase PcrA
VTGTDADVAPNQRLGALDENDWRPLGIDDLEPAAWDAIRDPGSTAVGAGPGAGKTEFLAQRAAFLLQTGRCAPPLRILAISYKRDSAANLARRVARRLPEHPGRLVSLTFDAFAKGLVDRFRSALPPAWALNGDYDIKFWTARSQRDFLTLMAGNAPTHMRSDLYGLPTDTFIADVVGTWPLPADPAAAPTTAAEFAAWSWWREFFLQPATQQVEFTMLNRLAELLIRTTPQLQRALRLTYPFVFVDEFQDTTSAQFTFLKSVFGGTAVITAVGDRKQRIMGFAGAMKDPLAEFVTEFAAQPYALEWNFRSSADLVLLQHIIAGRLDPAVVEPVSKATVEEGHVAASLWTYSTPDRQAAHIADWIAGDIAASGRGPADFALVARQKVADLEGHLANALAVHGIALRNDDTIYGTSRLQDLLKHEVTRLIVGVLRLAAQPDPWHSRRRSN